MCDLVENYAKKKAADAVAKVTEEAVKEAVKAKDSALRFF